MISFKKKTVSLYFSKNRQINLLKSWIGWVITEVMLIVFDITYCFFVYIRLFYLTLWANSNKKEVYFRNIN